LAVFPLIALEYRFIKKGKLPALRSQHSGFAELRFISVNILLSSANGVIRPFLSTKNALPDYPKNFHVEWRAVDISQTSAPEFELAPYFLHLVPSMTTKKYFRAY
jgi:hypothetical protein